WTTVAMLALTVIHPQMLFVLAPLAAVHLILRRSRRRTWLLVAIPFVVCAPLVLYNLRVLTGDPVVVAWSRQWKHQAPGFLSLLVALGLPLALAAVSVWRGAWRRGPEVVTLIAWVALGLSLVYLPNPVNIQRRLLDGIYIPVAL